jgi:hypothetical protein
MKKPLKESWLSYYVATPLKSVLCSLKECLETTAIKLKGGWYCEYCHKIHCRRVYKYKLIFAANGSTYVAQAATLRPTHEESSRWVCSLGKDAIVDEGWKPDYVTLGDKLQSAVSALGDTFKGGM